MGFDPATIAIAATIGSALIGGVGAVEQSNAAKAAAGFNSQVAANNAKTAQQNATFTAAEGEQNAATSEAKTKAQVAATLANQGASGVDVNSGSAVSVRSSEAELGMLDALTIRSNAARQAWGYQTQSVSDQSQSQLDKYQGEQASTAGLISGAGTVLSGVGSATAKYTDFLQQGSPINIFGPGGASAGFESGNNLF